MNAYLPARAATLPDSRERPASRAVCRASPGKLQPFVMTVRSRATLAVEIPSPI